jgi:hypothetical protein
MDVYPASSAICRAALHAGAISKTGGSVTVIPLIPVDGRRGYAGITRHGVTSYNGDGDASRSSFRFATPK